MSVYISILNERITLPEQYGDQLKELVKRLLEEHSLAGGEVGIIFVDDAYIRDLNRSYRGKDSPTDVLSFSYLEDGRADVTESGEYAVGDVYISVDQAAEQAQDAGHSLVRELALLVAHGTLHLLGYDHENEKDAQLMEEKEKGLLNRINPDPAGGQINE